MHKRTLQKTFSVLATSVPIVASGDGANALAAVEETGSDGRGLHWSHCGEGFPGTECAEARLPLDYDDPHGEQIVVRLARYRGANATASLLVNPGGPGGSGAQLVLGGFGQYMSDLLGGRFDIVGFDPRGVATSEPLRCFESEESSALFDGIPWFPYQLEQELPFYQAYEKFPALCDGQRIRTHMSTADVVRDLDRLRALLGDEKMHYLGFSYGSYIGNTYANMFPDKVGALVIDGVLDPLIWSSGLQVTSDRVATQDEFEEFLRLCDEASSECALSGEGGAGVRYDVVEAALLEAPIELEEDVVYSYDRFIGDTVGAMYAPEFSWGGPEGFAAFVASLYDVVLAEPGASERAAALLRALEERSEPPSPVPDYENSFEAYYGNHCEDAEYPAPLDDYSSIGLYAEAGSALGPYWWWANAGCAQWPIAEDRYAGPWTAETAAPVLVVGNYFDGVTDYAGAQSSANLLPNSRLLTYAGWGHAAFGVTPCVTDHVVAYLVDGTLPPEGTVCPAAANPFLPVPEDKSATGELRGASVQTWLSKARPRSPARRRVSR
jgi:pimeloyl-ACP methyl ester carboxylesterase